MRDLHAHEIRINLIEQTDQGRSVLDNVQFHIEPVGEFNPPQTVSSAFSPLYKSMVDNYEQSYLRDAVMAPAKMLIISHDGIEDIMEPFIQWKHTKGIATEYVTLTETGSSTAEIKAYIQNIYDTSDNPPDYLLLMGDVNEEYALPAYYFSAENNVTDHPYTMLEGDDFFPEMMVGRISFDAPFELQTVIAKILIYEKMPYMGDTDWFKKALLVAGNYSSQPPIPTTPVEVSKWLKDLMLEHDYEQVDEVYYPPTYPGTSQIVNAINDGLGFVSYRGWGDANGWHYPHFKRDDIDELNNGWRLPVVTSIVCNTGDFANSVDPCFGEALVTAGSPQTPSGAVVVVGPSDLHTGTKFNNAIFAGFYGGLLEENIMSFGAAVIRGKQELYDNYPNDREPGGYVEFYYYVYNILGDPSLTMWTDIPADVTLDESLPEEISSGSTHLEIHAADMNGANVTAINEDFLDITVIENGYALLQLNPGATGSYQIAVTKPNYEPMIQEIDIVQNTVDLGITAISADDLVAGYQTDIDLTIHNFGTDTADDVQAQLETQCPFANIISGAVDCGSIGTNNEYVATFTVELDADSPDDYAMEFTLDFGTYGNAKFELLSNNLVFEVVDFSISDGYLEPAETDDITITLRNIGVLDANALQAEIIPLSDAVQVNSGILDLGNVNTGQTATLTFNASAADDCFVGRVAGFTVRLTDDLGQVAEPFFAIEIGEVQNSDPTFSLGLDYYCYDSFDTGYSEVPTYQWLEIDPRDGGNGEVIIMQDDESISIPMPFDFTYFGNTYDSLTVCTNGWISFETTWMNNFTNWNIPAHLGPYAMVAPYWDDLIGENYGEGLYHDMRICHYYNQNDNTFIIEWNDCYNRDDLISVEKFQVVLYDPQHYSTVDGNGEIQFNYHTINNIDSNGNYCTVGIENQNQEHGLVYTFADIYPASATELQDGLALKFTTNPPDTYTGSENSDLIPDVAALNANYPNPFNPVTTISYSVPVQSNVDISVYNVKGQMVRNLVNDVIPQGNYQVIWDGLNDQLTPVTSGVYFYRLKVGSEFVETRKCLLLK